MVSQSKLEQAERNQGMQSNPKKHVLFTLLIALIFGILKFAFKIIKFLFKIINRQLERDLQVSHKNLFND